MAFPFARPSRAHMLQGKRKRRGSPFLRHLTPLAFVGEREGMGRGGRRCQPIQQFSVSEWRHRVAIERRGEGGTCNGDGRREGVLQTGGGGWVRIAGRQTAFFVSVVTPVRMLI